MPPNEHFKIIKDTIMKPSDWVLITTLLAVSMLLSAWCHANDLGARIDKLTAAVEKMVLVPEDDYPPEIGPIPAEKECTCGGTK